MSLLRTRRPGTTPNAPDAPPRGASELVRLPDELLLNAGRSGVGSGDPATVRALLEAGQYSRTLGPAVVVYRITAGAHQQTGIVVEASLRDYREGRIRRHEATQPGRERELDISTADAGFEQLPVTLTHPGRAELNSLLESVTTAEPDLSVSTTDGREHSVWFRRDHELLNAVRSELGQLHRLYIADGHHRMAAAERYSSRRSHPASAFTLAALFPSEELRILGYHRCLRRPSAYSTSELLAAVREQDGVRDLRPHDDAASPEIPGTQPGRVVMRMDGEWYQLDLHAPERHTGVRDSLDASVLDEAVLEPLARVLGLDPGGDITPVPSGTDGSLVRWCDSGAVLGFVPHPPTVEQVMAVSDAGLVMPAKSTWFDPKATPGMFVREIR